MEATWERKEDYVSLTLDEARRLLAPARYGVNSLVLIEEGKANTNYLAPLKIPIPELTYSCGGVHLYTWMPASRWRRPLPTREICRT